MFFRIDPNIFISCDDPEFEGLSFEIHIFKPVPKKIEISCGHGKKPLMVLYRLAGTNRWEKEKDLSTIAVSRIIEIGVDFADLEIKEKDEIEFVVSAKKHGREFESWPKGGMLALRAPDKDFEMSNWIV